MKTQTKQPKKDINIIDILSGFGFLTIGIIIIILPTISNPPRLILGLLFIIFGIVKICGEITK